MRVAIAGSTGMLGSALARNLLDEGHEVVRLVRGTPTEPDQRRWDPDAGRIDGPRLDDVDAVVNLAGAPIAGARWTDARKAEILRSRLSSTTTLVSVLAPDGRCRRLLNGSAIGIYGDTGPEIVDEDSPVGTGFLAGVVAQWEAAAAHAPVSTALLRTGHVLTRQGGFLGAQWALFAAGLGGRVGNGRQFVSWISLADHLRAMIFLLKSPVTGPVNLVAPEPVTNAEFTRAFGSYLRRPTMLPMPLPAVRMIFGGEFVTEALLSSTRVRPARLLAGGFEFRHSRIGDAFGELE